ncbi:MAG: hypothetical protein LBG27_12705 [Spirochaetaceae bacterium]|jgi:putative component of membrane protein insertase Oxa1/YidC/SpoIIIJ protein YidD|nr:hypothetical protein [Spirochaetaceae bacterium]
MLAKLIRYELKALLRILPIFYLSLVGLSVTVALISRAGLSGPSQVIEAIWFTVSGSIFIVNLVIVILRFRDNFLKNESYLMLTLPVHAWQLVASKAIAALCTFLLSGIAYTVSLLAFALRADSIFQIIRLFTLQSGGIDYLLLVIGGVTTVVFIVQQLCLIYAAMIVAQMAPRFRGLAGLGVYLAVMAIVEYPIIKAVLSVTESLDLRRTVFLLLTTVFAALYFAAATWLLEHKHNTE